MEIIPAILPRDFSEIEEKIELITGLSKIVQIDICDGKFVSNITWPYRKADENFEAIIHEEKGMPEWEKINYEFDLMTKDPTEDDVRKWLSAGAERIILHIESTENLDSILSLLNGLVEIGIAINITTSIDSLEKYIDRIQFIQCMGIRKIGFQGQRLDPDLISKIKDIKNKFPNMKVQVDGGITLENAPLLKNAGADRLVIGSALFESDNIVDTFKEFKQI